MFFFNSSHNWLARLQLVFYNVPWESQRYIDYIPGSGCSDFWNPSTRNGHAYLVYHWYHLRRDWKAVFKEHITCEGFDCQVLLLDECNNRQICQAYLPGGRLPLLHISLLNIHLLPRRETPSFVPTIIFPMKKSKLYRFSNENALQNQQSVQQVQW